MGDPRIDHATKQHWDKLTAQLRDAVQRLDAPEPVRAALSEVIDLHVAHEYREREIGSADPDMVLGVRCRSCDNALDDWVPTPSRPCLTMTRLAAHLLPASQTPGRPA